MRKIILLLALSVIMVSCKDKYSTLKSPNGEIATYFSVEDGKMYYELWNGNTRLLEKSPLGLVTSSHDMSEGLELVGISPVELIVKGYSLEGKKSNVRYLANEAVYTVRNPKGAEMDVVFRASNDGMAYRYVIKGKGETKVLYETSGFDLPESATAFVTPLSKGKSSWARTNPSYEEFYHLDEPVGAQSDYGQGWTYPALFKVNDDAWVLISETGNDRNYVFTHLSESTGKGLYKVEFPHEDNNLPEDPVYAEVELPCETPWRTVTAGTLAGVAESTMAHDLVDPLYDANYEYNPGRAAWSWIIKKDGNTVYGVQKDYIDMAARLGWEYLLIDALWDVQIGREKIAGLVEYADSKDVKIMLWYNSNGNWNDAPQTPMHLMDTKDARLTEMAWMQSIGIKGIKVDFFGGDKQVSARLYDDILRDANNHDLMVNFHGTTLPRGWEVMYPNFITAEAVKGQEFCTFEQEVADRQPGHAATIVFTRNVVGAMDFTPLALNERLGTSKGRGPIRRTTAGFELAMPVMFFSGLQHYAVVPENLDEFPSFVTDYLKEVPTVWDDTKLLAGYPGKNAVFARRSGDKWYIAGINGEAEPVEVSFGFPFLNGVSKAKMIGDVPGKRNKVGQADVELYDNKPFSVELQPGGGFVIVTE